MTDEEAQSDRPELRYDVWVGNTGDPHNRRIAEFVRREDAYAFARLIVGDYDHVFVGGIVRDLTPEPLHLTITLDGKNIAQVEALLTRLERAAGAFEPYIDSITGE